MNKIVLITTEGCAACNIMRNIINAAVLSTKKEVTFEYKDYKLINKKYLQNNNIKDFPAILFFKDDRLIRKQFGTHPTIVVLRWIDIDFK